MKYYIIAGEASGDLHAANLMRSIKDLDKDASFRCWGGDRMASEGGELVKHYRDLAFMGFLEVLLNIRTIMGNLRLCKRDLIDYSPDVLILVDYPGFNLRIAKYAALKGIRVFYYISPQVWAWKKSRVKDIRRYVERMYVILPFEKEFYAGYDYEVDFVGHPLLDAIDPDAAAEMGFMKKHDLDGRPVVALLPGSRKQEIRTMLPLMLEMIAEFPSYQFVIAAAPSIPDRFYHDIIRGREVKLIPGKLHDILKTANCAVVTSGTATLETALFKVPEVVCYKGGWISYMIARRLVKGIKYISLVNLIMDRQVVRELIQADFNRPELKKELGRLLQDDNYRDAMLDDMEALHAKLGGPGASATTAELMLKQLDDSK